MKEIKRELEFRKANSYSLEGIGGVILNKTIIAVVLSVSLVLSGCSYGSSIEKKLSDTMTEMNGAEKVYREAQAQLTDLEKTEQKLFNETMELTQGQREVLKTKVAELEGILAQRLGHLVEEETSISKAKVSAESFDAIIEQADERGKESIEALKTAVDKRYELHSEFVSEYKKLAMLQEELYGMLSAEETQLMELKNKVEEVNAQNEKVQSAVALFNELTGRVNILKDDVFTSLQEE